MGEATITPATVPAFLTSMRLGLATLAGFSCLGVLLSIGRGRRS